jgi:Na+/H+ antiporter NhaD/arsenite permease-like protein
MGDFLTTTNTIVSIIGTTITILGAVAGVLHKRRTVVRESEQQPQPVQVAVQEQWSGIGFIWRIWLALLFGLVFAVMFTAVPVFVINLFLYGIQQIQHPVTEATTPPPPPDFSNPVVFLLCALFGVSIGITVAVGIATGRTGRTGQTGQTRRVVE